jgi:hypothetical protein
MIIHYGIALLSLVVLPYFNIGLSGRYWRYLVLFTTFLTEFTICTRTTYPTILALLTNYLLPFQLIKLLRKLMVVLFIAFNQVGPLFDDRYMAEVTEAKFHDELDSIELICEKLSNESNFNVAREYLPFEENMVNGIKTKVLEDVMNSQIKNDPEVNDAIESLQATITEKYNLQRYEMKQDMETN